MDMSRMPLRAIFRVRGMGVADRVGTSTCLKFSFSFSLCWTPKRCSSSTTSSPKSLKRTSRLNSRCVPMRISTSPVSTFRNVSFIWAGVRKRETTSMFTGYFWKRRRAVR